MVVYSTYASVAGSSYMWLFRPLVVEIDIPRCLTHLDCGGGWRDLLGDSRYHNDLAGPYIYMLLLWKLDLTLHCVASWCYPCRSTPHGKFCSVPALRTRTCLTTRTTASAHSLPFPATQTRWKVSTRKQNQHMEESMAMGSSWWEMQS